LKGDSAPPENPPGMLREILAGLKTLTLGHGKTATGERRRLVRLKCRYPVTCELEKSAFRAVVVDMGVQGLRLEIPERLKRGQVVHVTYPSTQAHFAVDSVRCVVNWTRRNPQGQLEAGLRYDDLESNLEKSWVKVILRELGFDAASIFQRRKARRVVAMLQVQLRRPGRTGLTARVLNLGVGGALLQTLDPFDRGQVLTMDLGPVKGLSVLSVSAEVLTCRYEPRSQSWFCGVRFSGLSDRQLDLLSRYLVHLLKDSVD